MSSFFCQYSFVQKLQSQTVIREKLQNTFDEKAALKMFVKLTPKSFFTNMLGYKENYFCLKIQKYTENPSITLSSKIVAHKMLMKLTTRRKSKILRQIIEMVFYNF
jgi:hypothetical protein